MREMYIDEFGRPVSPSMAAQYSPPHEHMIPSWPLPPALPYPAGTGPMSPPYTSQPGPYPHPSPIAPGFVPHPHFFPVYFGHPHPGIPPPPPAMAPEPPHLGQPGMWYHPPEGSGIPPFAQVSYKVHGIWPS